jgi:hypothetical protein
MVSPRFMTQPDEAATALFRFLMENPDAFPPDMREKIVSFLEPGKSISFAVSETAEMIFARQEELSAPVLLLGAELAITASNNRINNFADEGGNRGRGIAEALRRASGEQTPGGMSWPSRDEDPVPKDVYLAAVGSESADAPAPEPK